MKFRASPLVVAVALGMLSPIALLPEMDDPPGGAERDDARLDPAQDADRVTPDDDDAPA